MKKDADGEITEIIAEIVPGTLGKNVEGVKARGVIQWVSATEAIDITVNNYDILFTTPNPAAVEGDVFDYVNKESLVVKTAKAEPSLKTAEAEVAYQFERVGYYARDPKAEGLEFNLVVALKDSFGE